MVVDSLWYTCFKTVFNMNLKHVYALYNNKLFQYI